MHIASDYNEDIMHTYWVYRSKDCLDCSYCFDSELMYECVDCSKCYNCDMSQDCQNCFYCKYCYDCIGCSNCIGCVGLRRKQFYIFNEKFSQEDFNKKIHQLASDEILQNLELLKSKTPRLYTHALHNENSTGDYIFHTKSCYECYDTNYAEDCTYIDGGVSGFKNCMDCSFFMDAELCYECVSVCGYNLNFCHICWDCSDLEFCEQCFNCRNCFGCVGLKAKEYHILNEPYSREEYEKEVAEIKKDLKTQGLYNMDLIGSCYPIEDSCISEHI
jgi:hypothetical protein